MLSGEKNVEKREGTLEREIEPKPGNVGGECQRHTPPLTTFDWGQSRKSHNGTVIVSNSWKYEVSRRK